MPAQVADAVAVGVLERARVDLVDDAALPPAHGARVRVIGSPAHGPLPDDRGPGGRDLAAVAGAGAGLRGGRRPGAVPLRPPAQPLRAQGARLARRVGDDRGAGRPHEHAAARHARLPRHVPPSLRRGEDGRGRRPRVGRARRARPRSRLVRARARRLRLPVPAAEGAHGHARRAARDRPRPVGRRRVLVRGRALRPRGPRRAAEAAPAAAPAAADGWQGRPARRGAGRPLGGRVQHPVRAARGRAGDEGPRQRGVRGRRPRADPLLAHDRRADRPRPRRAARPRAAAGRAQRR